MYKGPFELDWVGNTQYLNEGFQGSTTDIGGIAMAFYSGLWSFYGWQDYNPLKFIIEWIKLNHSLQECSKLHNGGSERSFAQPSSSHYYWDHFSDWLLFGRQCRISNNFESRRDNQFQCRCYGTSWILPDYVIDLLYYVLNIKDVGNALLGPVAFIIPLAVAMSTFGTVLAGFFRNARLIIN